MPHGKPGDLEACRRQASEFSIVQFRDCIVRYLEAKAAPADREWIACQLRMFSAGEACWAQQTCSVTCEEVMRREGKRCSDEAGVRKEFPGCYDRWMESVSGP